jgi:hypothetical protein
MTAFGACLFVSAAGAFLVGVSYVVFPWTLQLGFRELPAAFWALLSGRRALRRLRRLLKARHEADREIEASLPKGELGIVIAARQVYAGLAAAWQRAVVKLVSLPSAGEGPRLPGPVTAACLEQARRSDAGREAVRARAEHDRYEREFAAASRRAARCLDFQGQHVDVFSRPLDGGPELYG